MPDDKKARVVMTKGGRERSVSEGAVEFRRKTGWKIKSGASTTKPKEG